MYVCICDIFTYLIINEKLEELHASMKGPKYIEVKGICILIPF